MIRTVTLLGAGGKMGSGRQYMPWIHREDWIALVHWAIQAPTVAVAINGTAPNPVTNAEFARALGHAMRRPAFMPAPAPARPERLGFTFRYPQLAQALAAITIT